jgi:hypothetical protein
MAMNAALGYFKTGTSTGALTPVTGLGFTPEVLIFWLSGRTDITDAEGGATYQFGAGFGISSSLRQCAGISSDDGATSSNAGVINRALQCAVAALATSGNIDGAVDVISLDADGFSLTVDADFANDLTVHYLALGGDITNATCGSFTIGTGDGTGAKALTGVGFLPDLLIFLSTTTTGATSSAPGAGFAFGAATAAASEFVVGVGVQDGQGTMNTIRYGFGDECIAMADPTYAGFDVRASFTSMDADGFTINVEEVARTRNVNYLALKGGYYAVGDFLTRTDGNDIAVTGTGVNPSAVLFASHCTAESTQDTKQDSAVMSLGAAVSTSSRAACAMSDQDALADSECYAGVEFDEVYIRPDLADGHEGLMDLKSLDSDGFTCVMDDTDPDAAFVGYVAFGVASAGDVNVEPGAASITWAGFAPTFETIVHPGAASVTWAGFAPTIALGPLTVLPTAASVTWAGSAPTLGNTVQLTTINTTSSVAVGAGVEFTIQPGAASIVWTAYAPGLDTWVYPSAAAVTWAGFAPTIDTSASKTIEPGTAAITWQGFAPGIEALNPVTVEPGAAVVTWAGQVPTINVGLHITIEPGAGLISWAGFAPTVDPWSGFYCAPVGASITWAAYAPTINVTSVDVEVYPSYATITWTGYAPRVAADVKLCRLTNFSLAFSQLDDVTLEF